MNPFTVHISSKALTEICSKKVTGFARNKPNSTPSPAPSITSVATSRTALSSTSTLTPDSKHPTSDLASATTLNFAPDPSRGERLLSIFPPGLEGSSKRIDPVPYTFTPEYLLDVLVRDRYNPRVQHVVVRSAWYGKQTKSAKHEFIVVEIGDLAEPGLQNYMTIDRNPKDPKGGQNITGISSSTNAEDVFRVSYDGNLSALLRGSRLTPYLKLEELHFQGSDVLLLGGLVALVRHISDRHKKFNALDTNCFWFTGLIWECMLKMNPTAQYETHLPGRRGKIAFARIVSDPVQVSDVIRGFKCPNQDVQSTKL